MQVTVSPVRKFMAETCSVRFDFENEEGGRRREMRFEEGRDRRETEGKVWVIGSDPIVNFSPRVLQHWNLRAWEMKEAMILGQQK